MQSEPAIENRAAQSAARGRRRKRGNGSVEGPVFVDNSGRRSKLLRRIGLLVGVACMGYAVVLGMAFMGVGTSLTPSELLPFGAGGPAGGPNSGPGGAQPQGGVATPPTKPTGTPPSGTATGEPPSAAPTVFASPATAN
ncbi:hypothetical protein EJ357_27080 [Streptomyces cyaneochromogenes]|uniref:Uncharacterized protein n=1 Tax=Streptomyces cyaneochromogenes TaxID=2496836 RepID=A0A3Q9EVH6_9ACTN|nr:hypothetical protein [Streptomyces cyaneochromogenes]AZQ36651.1 hypothetical protein EJ357_27080 [Streptomyces cyaneochromogenes]